MTVAAGSVVLGPFNPNGLVTDWAFDFTAYADAEVVPRLVTASGSSIPTHTVTRNNVEDITASGGVVVIDPPLAGGSGQLFISYIPSFQQETEFEDQARFSPTVMNYALDLAASRDQYMDAKIDRAQKVPLGELGPAIASAAVRGGSFRAWSDDASAERTDLKVSTWFNYGSAIALLQAAVTTLQAQVAALFRLVALGTAGGSGGVGIDLGRYLLPTDALTDAQLAAYVDTGTVGWTNVADKLRQAFADAGAAGLPVDATRLRGMYYVDPGLTSPGNLPWPILIRSGSGFIGPEVAKCQMAYTVGGDNVVRYRLVNPGLTFIVDTHSTRKDYPWFARQGGTVIRGLMIAGVGLLNDVAGINVTNYKTTGIVGAPTDHAPVLVTDHRHDTTGALVSSAKAGITVCQAHIIAVMQAAYHGDPLISEESWATLTASGQQTGMSFTEELTITASPMKRVLGVARSTAGGFKCKIQAIPPYATFMSQPAAAGGPGTGQKLLKWFQKNGVVLDRWHRMVGFDITIEARGFRYGEFVRAGYNAVGPSPTFQDTGKFNAGRIQFNCERVITAVHVEPNAYLHRYEAELNGHYMDEYNLAGENGALIDIQTDGTVAGAVDKAVYDLAALSVLYSIDDKVSDGSSNVFSCTQAGLSTVVPTPSGGNYNGATKIFTDPGSTLRWIFRNAGFKPVGAQPFATAKFRGVVQETSGPVFRNTANDGHKFHDLSGLSFSNWQQASAHHGDGAIISAGPNTLVIHHNARVSASGNSQRVYETSDLSNVWIGSNGYFGYALPADGTDPPEIGGNFPATYFHERGCEAFNFGVYTGDDDSDDNSGASD